jgi:hypothetical protein
LWLIFASRISLAMSFMLTPFRLPFISRPYGVVLMSYSQKEQRFCCGILAS